MVPLHLRGTNDRANLQSLCKACHRAKTTVEIQAARTRAGLPPVQVDGRGRLSLPEPEPEPEPEQPVIA